MKRLPQILLTLFSVLHLACASALAPVWLSWPAHSGYNLDQIFRVEKAPNPAFGGFFWSHQFYVGDANSANVMYMGMQQQMDGTRNVIFSIFYDADTKVNSGNVKCPLPKYISCVATQSAGDNTPGAQIIAPYAWVEGHDYRFRVWNVGVGWWNFYVMDLTTNAEIYVGSIYSQNRPNGVLNPGNYSVQWEEVYGGQQAFGNCAYSPQRVFVTSPTMDDLTVTPNNYNYDATQSPFRIFPESGNKHYEMLSCPLGGFPRGSYGNTACYFLGGSSQSCDAVCNSAQTLPTPQCSTAISYTRGGVGTDAATLPYLGTPQQGGSVDKCDDLLASFNLPKAQAGTRIDGQGLGCHVYPPNSWWLISPNTTAASAAPGAQRVCGCVP